MPERRYGETGIVGGRIARARFGSPAWRAGIRPGDRVVAVDGRPIVDILDWRWATAAGSVDIEILRDGVLRAARLRAGHGPLGIEFEGELFDGVRECTNACSFCFVAQLPRGLRRSLYVRDDDFRLSFLHGNFITLTNLMDADVLRIAEQRLSPLYVSLHAVDEEVRRQLIAPRGEDRALERLDELLAYGIEIHVQVVTVPGVNDGDVLRQTLEYLKPRRGVASVGVVPLGFTKHQRRFSASYDALRAAEVLSLVHAFQERAKSIRGISWVYAADEFYLLAGADIPPADAYDSFPQFENGIGLVRSFLDDFDVAAPALSVRRTSPVVLVTGSMFAPILSSVMQRIPGAGRARVLSVENVLLGGNVGVTGLLSGDDIVRAIVAHGGEGTYLVPDIVLNSDALTLDDMAMRDIQRRSHARVRLVGSTAADLARVLAHL